MKFKELKIIEPIVQSLEKMGIIDATPIQIDAIPKILDKKDILARAATGTGKTAAFVVPILQMMENAKRFQEYNRHAQVLVISPNRELSIQISDAFKKTGTLLNTKVVTIIGGVYQRKQIEILRNSVDVLVVTPGRCRDLIEQRKLNLDDIKYFILDEVDLILDMGFIEDVKFIRKSVKQEVQTIFLSATIPPKIKSLAENMLKNYEYVQSKIDLEKQGKITEELYFMKAIDKKYFLLDLISKNSDKSFIIFSNMKRKVDDIEKFLKSNNFFSRSIHSDKSQFFRQEAIRLFKSKKTLILIATDIAARGIHIDNINYVINFDIPKNSDVYVHRKGRTGRAGDDGHSLLLCSPEEAGSLKSIIRNVSPAMLPIDTHKWHIDINLQQAFAKSGNNNVFRNKNTRRNSSSNYGSRFNDGNSRFNDNNKPRENSSDSSNYSNNSNSFRSNDRNDSRRNKSGGYSYNSKSNGSNKKWDNSDSKFNSQSQGRRSSLKYGDQIKTKTANNDKFKTNKDFYK